jgi:ubiquitin
MLSMKNPKNNSYSIYKSIKVDSTASELKSKIKAYYKDTWNSYINVNMTMFDVNGTNTTNST